MFPLFHVSSVLGSVVWCAALGALEILSKGIILRTPFLSWVEKLPQCTLLKRSWQDRAQ